MREIFESTIERLLGDTVTPELLRSCDQGQWPEALWAGVEESGFSVAAAPEELGGAGASWFDLYPVVRSLGRHAAPIPLAEAMLGNWLLGRAGLEAVSGVLSIGAQAGLTLKNGRVSGQLVDVPWGRQAERVVAIAAGATADASPTVVLLSTASSSARTLQLNTAGEPRDTLQWTEAEPLASAPLPAGLSAEVLTLGGAMLRSAQIAGAMHRALDMASQYATERVQFGKPIGNFQSIQHQLAVMAEHTAASIVSAEAAFATADDGAFSEWAIAAAKVCTAEAAGIGAGTAHGVHGAIGFTHEHVLHLTTRRLWSWRSEYGSLTAWSQRLGQLACRRGGAGLWPLVTSMGAAA